VEQIVLPGLQHTLSHGQTVARGNILSYRFSPVLTSLELAVLLNRQKNGFSINGPLMSVSLAIFL
jgi:hypothetical protein